MRLQELIGLTADGAERSHGLVWASLEESASALKAFYQNEVKIQIHLRQSRWALERTEDETSQLLSTIEEELPTEISWHFRYVWGIYTRTRLPGSLSRKYHLGWQRASQGEQTKTRENCY